MGIFVDVGRSEKPDYINLSHVSRVQYDGRYRTGPGGVIRVHVEVYYGGYENYPLSLALSDDQWHEMRKKLSEARGWGEHYPPHLAHGL